MQVKLFGLGLLLIFWLGASEARGEQQVQHWLTAQHDWGGRRGFFLSVQNVANTGSPATLKNCRVQFGIGDGAQWHFVEASTDWSTGRKYVVRAVIRNGTATLWLDDREAGSTGVNFVSADVTFSAGYQPGFLIGPADYRVVQFDLRVVSDRDRFEHTFEVGKDQGAIESLRILNPTIGALRRPLQVDHSVEIEASFAFEPMSSDLRKIGALVDRFGQALAADFPEKVTKDQQLVASIAAEEQQLKRWPKPDGYDRFGGYRLSGWKAEASGFYRVEKRAEFWWLISPEGNPCFYLGLCDAPSLTWEGTPVSGREFMFKELPPRQGLFADAWKKNIWESESPDVDYLVPHTVNLVRKYGPGWQAKANASTVARLGALGFGGLGKWCQPMPQVPIVQVIYPKGVDMLTSHPDPWNSKVREQVRFWLEKEIGPRRDDPWVVGWSIGNERDAFPSPDDVVKVLAGAVDTPARQAMIAWANSHGLDPASDQGRERLREYYADSLFDLYYTTIKQVDPHHLNLGNWVTPNWWFNKNDWDSIANHCDVIGFDRYAMSLKDPPMQSLLGAYEKPMLCGEFSFPADYGGRRGYGTYPISVVTEQESGQCYGRWIADCVAQPKIIGALYFQYRDQPLLGRGPGAGAEIPILGENFAFGLVDVTDRLKTQLCQSVRAANLNAVTARLKASGPLN
jgi:hypothetical protein